MTNWMTSHSLCVFIMYRYHFSGYVKKMILKRFSLTEILLINVIFEILFFCLIYCTDLQRNIDNLIVWVWEMTMIVYPFQLLLCICPCVIDFFFSRECRHYRMHFVSERSCVCSRKKKKLTMSWCPTYVHRINLRRHDIEISSRDIIIRNNNRRFHVFKY